VTQLPDAVLWVRCLGIMLRGANVTGDAAVATASSPFITYTLPRQTPAALQPSGTSELLPETQV
jgi:hypothetical protein